MNGTPRGGKANGGQVNQIKAPKNHGRRTMIGGVKKDLSPEERTLKNRTRYLTEPRALTNLTRQTPGIRSWQMK